MRTTLLVLTWNEIDGMRAIMPRVRREWVDQILVVDNGSTDGTVEFALQQGYEICHQKKKGLRRAYEEAWPLVRGDVVIPFAPDGSSLPDRIPLLIEKMREGYDMVIVSRYRDDARSEDDNWLTAFGNWMFTALINVCFGARYTDSLVMYRALRKELAEQLQLFDEAAYQPMERILRTAPGFEVLLTVRAAKQQCKVTEIPGDEPKRIGGTQKMRPFRWGLFNLIQILREIGSH